MVNYKCSECFQPFYSLSDLEEHERIHIDKNPFKCGICGKIFDMETRFNNELRSFDDRLQTGGESLSCTNCDKKFDNGNCLNDSGGSGDPVNQYMSKENPFQCEKCEKRFARTGDLKIHERVHMDEEMKAKAVRQFVLETKQT